MKQGKTPSPASYIVPALSMPSRLAHAHSNSRREKSDAFKGKTLLGRALLALLLCFACIPAQSLAFARQAWAEEGIADFYLVLYEKPGQSGYDLVLQQSDQEDARFGTKAEAYLYSDNFNFDNFNYPSGRFEFPGNPSHVKHVLVQNTLKAPDSINCLFGDLDNCISIDLTGFDTSNVTDMIGLFSGCSSLKSLNLGSLDTSNVTDMNGLFLDCSSLESLNLGSLDTSNVTDMAGMFEGCSSLETLDLSGFDTAQVDNMFGMFWGCSSLKSLNLSGFNTSKVTDMCSMFFECTSLKTLNLSGFDTSQVTWMGRGEEPGMFMGCSSLETLDLRAFDTSKVGDMNGMFSGCSSLKRIDATDKFVTSALWYEPTNVFSDCTSLQGGNGTKYSASHTDTSYACIDAPGRPGYFTGQASYLPSKPKPADPKPQPVIPVSTPISGAKVTVADKAYTGKTLKPSSVAVAVGGKKLVAGRDFTISCKGGKAVGSYKVTIKGIGSYTGTKTATFKILPKGTSISKVKAAKRRFTVTWKKPSKANLKQTTGYKVQWSTDKKFKKGVKSKLVKKSKTTSLKVSKLKGGKKYYVRVCTYKKVGGKYYYSSWSKAKAVKTKR